MTIYNLNIIFFIYVVLVLFLIIPKAIYSKIHSDTLSTKSKEVLVTNSKFQSILNTSIKVDKINEKIVKKLNPIMSFDLVKLTNGLYINDYGGLGGIKTVSMRGLASNNTMVMLNGVRLNSSQNGSYDFSTLNISNISEMEYSKNGLSGFLGGNSAGGVINFRTNSNKNDINFSYGSLNEKSIKINKRLNFLDSNLSTGINYINSDGNYRFNNIQFDKNLTFRRENSNFRNLSINLDYLNDNLNAFLSDNEKLSLNLIYSNTLRGVPGPVLQNNIENTDAKLIESDFKILLNYDLLYFNNSDKNIEASSDKSDNNDNKNIEKLELRGMTNVNYMSYIDKNAIYFSEEGINSQFNSFDNYFKLTYKNISKEFEFNINTEINNNNLIGNMLDVSLDNKVNRLNLSLNTFINYNLSNFISNKEYNVDFYNTLRLDNFSDFGNVFSYLVGTNIELKNINSSINYNYSKNYRPPSFNEMYYLNFGNQDLIPEISHSQTIILSNNSIPNLKITNTFNYINLENKIVSLPSSPVVWTAYNLGNANVTSYELDAVYDLSEIINSELSLNFSYLIQDVRDKTIGSQTFDKLLPYTPKEIITLNLIYKITNFDILLINRYNSFRYYTTNNNYNEILSAYLQTDLNISYNLESILTDYQNTIIYLTINNILNNQYELIKNYPMPGIIFRGGVKIGL